MAFQRNGLGTECRGRDLNPRSLSDINTHACSLSYSQVLFTKEMVSNPTPAEMVSELCDKISFHSKKYGGGIIKSVLIKEDGQYRLHSGVISFIPKGETVIEEKRDYGEILLITQLLKPINVKDILRELEKNQKFTIEGYRSFEAQGRFQRLLFLPSQNRTGYIFSEWPRTYVEYTLSDRNISYPSEPLVKPGLPLFPDGRKAILDFLELNTDQPPTSILIQIPDFRLKIKTLLISGKSVKLEVERGDTLDNIICKFYADYEEHRMFSGQRFYAMKSPELDVADNLTEYEFKKDFTYVFGLLMDKKSGETLDYRGFNFGWPSQEGVTIEIQELELREIIRRGESLHVEFKQNLDNPDRILKTIVAFANTGGGRIFIGVSDDTRIIGYDLENKDQITNLISGNIEPLPNFEVKRVEINDKHITIIEIPEGVNKPYSHRELGFFIRSGGTNRSATRTDMDILYKEKESEYPSFR